MVNTSGCKESSLAFSDNNNKNVQLNSLPKFCELTTDDCSLGDPPFVEQKEGKAFSRERTACDAVYLPWL